jgi:hypothetical protein
MSTGRALRPASAQAQPPEHSHWDYVEVQGQFADFETWANLNLEHDRGRQSAEPRATSSLAGRLMPAALSAGRELLEASDRATDDVSGRRGPRRG